MVFRKILDDLSPNQRFFFGLAVIGLCVYMMYNAVFVIGARTVCENSDGLLYRDDFDGRMKCVIPDNVGLCSDKVGNLMQINDKYNNLVDFDLNISD